MYIGGWYTMKRIMIVLLAIVILLSCVACDNNSPKDGDNDTKIVSEYMGEWKANSLKSRDNDEITYKVATITLQEDGTCIYKGESAKWEYVAELNQFIFTLDRNGVSGTLEIAEENGKTVLKYNTEIYYRPTDFIAKEKEYINVGNTYSCKKEIEITLDNWDQYFEIVENTDWRKNAFGEAENLNISYSFKLKDEYQTAYDNDIAVEIHAEKVLVDIDLDLAEGKYCYLDVINETYDFNTIETLTGNEINFFSCSDGYFEQNDIKVSNIEILKNIEILRIQGKIYLYE